MWRLSTTSCVTKPKPRAVPAGQSGSPSAAAARGQVAAAKAAAVAEATGKVRLAQLPFTSLGTLRPSRRQQGVDLFYSAHRSVTMASARSNWSTCQTFSNANFDN